MNRQLAFETAAKKLLEQGERSISDVAGGCAYRGCEGRRCAIGWLIPDEFYNADFEGSAASVRGVLNAIDSVYEVSEHSHDDIAFLDSLQYIHDSYLPERWHDAFNDFAEDYCLDASFLESADE